MCGPRKVHIPGERTSPRKRKVRGDVAKRAEPKRAEPSRAVEDGEGDLSESGVELDADTFQKVREGDS